MSTNKYTQLEAVIYSSEQHACSIIHYIPPGIYVASEEWSCSKGDWPINESSNLATQIIKHDGIFTNMWGKQFKTRSLILECFGYTCNYQKKIIIKNQTKTKS